MTEMKTLLLLLIVALIPVSYADPSAETQNEPVNQEMPQNQEDDVRDLKGEIEDLLEDFLGRYEGLYIPAIPTLNVNFGEVVSISLALAQLNLTGISNVTVTKAGPILPAGTIQLEMTIPSVALNVGHYSSGGHILNLPFSGEGPLRIALHKLYIYIKIQAGNNDRGEVSDDICAKAGSTSFNLDLPRFEVEFSNMNPGTDLGQLLNIVLSSFGADIVDYLEILINGQFKEATEQILIDAFNTYSPSCQNWESEEPLDDTRISKYLNDLLEHYLQAFKVPGSIRTA